MERAWEEERLARRTAALIARRERPLTPERSPSRGARAAEWFLHRLDAATSADEPIRARFEPATGDIPARLKSAMMECQKPFQLWNVTRIAEVARLAFEALPPYKVGSAGLEPADREGRPGRVVPASRLLRGAREEAELTRSDAFGARRRLKRLLAESAEEQGLGVPDEGSSSQGSRS